MSIQNTTGISHPTAKEWRRRDAPPAGFAAALGLPFFQAHLLYNRGIRSRAEVEPFLFADVRLLNNPFLLPDMDRAVARLTKALKIGETIGVFGDFDTDGVTGTALLVRALRDLGGSVIPYLPDRVDEGHGLNGQAMRQLQDMGVSLLVTVDCGATSVEEVAWANRAGIDTIITDHHTLLPALPEACALINPRREDSAYPYGHLTGVGMSFKLVEALYATLGRPWPEHLLELVALGTVADIGPLTGENRFLVKRGLENLNKTQSPGIRALVSAAGLKLGALDTESLSFGLIPRLNVAGRLDHANLSLNLLTTASESQAEALAYELNRRNSERQRLTEICVAEAQGQIEAGGGVTSIIIVESKDWIPGVLGLIASKLVDTYYRPVVAISVGEELSRASARSIPEFNMVEALRGSGDLFTKYGGHPQAAGFTIPTRDLPEIKRSLQSSADSALRDANLAPFISVECEVAPAIFVGDNFSFIQSLSPFGEGNPAPLFLTRSARVVDARQVGNGGNHLKMRLWHDGAVWDAIAFRQGSKVGLTRERIDLVYTIGLDTWGSVPKLQLTVQDFRKAR